jgi:hypothetical protein
MKIAVGIALIALGVGPASAQLYGSQNSGIYGTGSNPSSHYVQPHTTSSGTYVSGHDQTNPTVRSSTTTAPAGTLTRIPALRGRGRQGTNLVLTAGGPAPAHQR